MFKMKPNESIVEMFTRFTDVVNGLEGLGKRVSKQDKVSKILRCIPPKWNSKTEAIEEAKNLKELPLEELIGSLMTYEMKIARQEKEMQEESKKKSIALKAQEEKVVEEAKLSNMEDDIALITKRMQKFMMKNKFGGKTYNKRSNYKKEGPSKEEKENREGAKEVTCLQTSPQPSRSNPTTPARSNLARLKKISIIKFVMKLYDFRGIYRIFWSHNSHWIVKNNCDLILTIEFDFG